MIELSNGIKFDRLNELVDCIDGMDSIKQHLERIVSYASSSTSIGRNSAISTAIAAIDAAIENAELALKSAQQREVKMKTAKKLAVKKVAKPVAKKPAAKKPAAKKK